MKKLVMAVVMCLMAASTDDAFGQSGRVGGMARGSADGRKGEAFS